MTDFIPKQMTFADVSDEYQAFVDKFKPKKTTDDCYTPNNVYEAVLGWVCKEYGVDRAKVVRPFYPGGDYERADYPQGCTVVDNPPFSILAQIVRFYNAHNVPYFLFAPSLTNFQTRDCSHVVADCNITYENGAVVRTGFLTNLDRECKVRTAPALKEAVDAANEANTKAGKVNLPKYIYPNHVLTASKVQWFAAHGVDYRLRFGDGYCRIGTLDAQRAVGKSIFGDGYLLSDKAAAERAAAERWQLSERELRIVSMLGGGAS